MAIILATNMEQELTVTSLVGDMFPAATVLGIDLSPIQPIWVPPNVNFLIEDVEDEWIHSSDFDFIHLRQMTNLLKSPEKLIHTMFR